MGRTIFGISDRDLAVLNALVSFYRPDRIDEGEGTIVFPSNRALAERAHGMAESTLRRHLAALVAAGLILRHDSPNGKRYAARDETGALARVFGFDLRPLLVRVGEIQKAAAGVRAHQLRLRRLREGVVLRLRDAVKLLAYGRETVKADWDALESRMRTAQTALRRKPEETLLQGLNQDVQQVLDAINARLKTANTENMDGNDVENERHIQYSNKSFNDSEPCKEQQGREVDRSDKPTTQRNEVLPLYLVLKACPDLMEYFPDRPKHWHQLVAAADFVRPMLGISPDAWFAARDAMGPEVAAITLACMLQRGSDIAKPGGYLRVLTQKAADGAFSPGPMVMALLRADNRAAV